MYMTYKFNDPFANLPAPDDSQFDTTSLALEPREGEIASPTMDGELSLVEIEQHAANEADPNKRINTPEVWLPGEYEKSLLKGESIDGIPSSVYVNITMGTTDNKNEGGTKRVWLSENNGKNFINELVYETLGGQDISRHGNKLELKEGEEVMLGREFNDERDSSEHFAFDDKRYRRVSRKHLSVTLKSGTYRIKDLNSSNGSFIYMTIKRPPKPKEPEEEPLPKIIL
jgi:hypothetical protein